MALSGPKRESVPVEMGKGCEGGRECLAGRAGGLERSSLEGKLRGRKTTEFDERVVQ